MTNERTRTMFTPAEYEVADALYVGYDEEGVIYVRDGAGNHILVGADADALADRLRQLARVAT